MEQTKTALITKITEVNRMDNDSPYTKIGWLNGTIHYALIHGEITNENWYTIARNFLATLDPESTLDQGKIDDILEEGRNRGYDIIIKNAEQ
jgi:hypothetical protein